jgi:hypothetical protein
MLQDFHIQTKNSWQAIAGPNFTFNLYKNGSYYTTIQNQIDWVGARRAAETLIQLYVNWWE